MPYITQEERDKIDQLLRPLLNSGSFSLTPGNINYIISRVIHRFISLNTVCYEVLNTAMGILECAKASLIETVLIPYEKIKMEENGEISALDEDYYETL